MNSGKLKGSPHRTHSLRLSAAYGKWYGIDAVFLQKKESISPEGQRILISPV
jgi:hypothetical protein